MSDTLNRIVTKTEKQVCNKALSDAHEWSTRVKYYKKMWNEEKWEWNKANKELTDVVEWRECNKANTDLTDVVEWRECLRRRKQTWNEDRNEMKKALWVAKAWQKSLKHPKEIDDTEDM